MGPSLQAASTIQATTKESIYMDMTIAEVEKMQAKQGNMANQIPTKNLDKNKTVRQILEEQKAQNQQQGQVTTLIDKANNAYAAKPNVWNKNQNNFKPAPNNQKQAIANNMNPIPANNQNNKAFINPQKANPVNNMNQNRNNYTNQQQNNF